MIPRISKKVTSVVPVSSITTSHIVPIHCYMNLRYMRSTIESLIANNNLFRRDNFTYFWQILLLLSTAGTISMCFDSSEQERFDASESIVLIPLPTRSMLFMISAYDSIAMYLAIEPQSRERTEGNS